MTQDTLALMTRIDSGWRPKPLPLEEDLRRCREIAEAAAERLIGNPQDAALLMAAIAIKNREKRLLGLP